MTTKTKKRPSTYRIAGVTFDHELYERILGNGLSCGIGTPDPNDPGKSEVCIEAAISIACGLPFGDDPECVAPAIRAFKISLNDSYRWASPQSRADGMRRLGIAQLGSAGKVDEREFVKRMTEKTIRRMIPTLFREIFKQDTPEHKRCRDAAEVCEREGTIESAYAANAAAYAAADAARAAAYAAYAANAAAYAADAAACLLYTSD
ncbi:MAG TPA: hypothetical protein DCQ33_12750, partial [Nitrospira sp.]|nr:hypothetical protein [Nitrospira sp.]